MKTYITKNQSIYIDTVRGRTVKLYDGYATRVKLSGLLVTMPAINSEYRPEPSQDYQILISPYHFLWKFANEEAWYDEGDFESVLHGDFCRPSDDNILYDEQWDEELFYHYLNSPGNEVTSARDKLADAQEAYDYIINYMSHYPAN